MHLLWQLKIKLVGKNITLLRFSLLRMGIFGAAHVITNVNLIFKLSQPQFYKDLTRKTVFFLRWSWFKFNNLELALCANLKFYTTVVKGLKLKVRMFLGLTPTFLEVTGEKLVGGPFCPPPPSPILNRVNTCKYHHAEALFIFSLCETMSRRGCIYDVSVWPVFLFYFDHN